MKLSTLLLAVEAALTPLVASLPGTVEVFVTPFDALQKLDTTPDKVRVLVGFGGGQNFGSNGTAEKTTLNVIVQGGRGLSFDPAADALRGTSTKEALLDQIEQVIAWVRAIRFYADEGLTVPLAKHVDCNFGFVPRSLVWLGDADVLPATRNAMASFTIDRAIQQTEEIKIPILNP